MDLRKAIEDLRSEKARLDRAIAALEELQGIPTGATLKTKSRREKSLKPTPSEEARQG